MRRQRELPTRLLEALKEIVDERRYLIEYWTEELGRQNLAPEDLPFADLAIDGFSTQMSLDQRFHEIADALLDHMTAKAPTLWPRLCADDVVGAMRLIFVEEGESPSALASPEALYEALTCSIQEHRKDVKLRFFLAPLRCIGSADHFPRFAKDLPVPADFVKDTCMRRVTVGVSDVSDDDLLVCVRCSVTDNTKPGFMRSCVDILVQAACVSSAEQCLPPPPESGFLAAPRTPGHIYDRDSVVAGAYAFANPVDWQALTESPEENPEKFVLPWGLTVLDAQRFGWLCENVVFQAGLTREGTNKERKRDVVRSAVWTMAQCSHLGQSPAALLGYAAVFERGVSALKSDCRQLGAATSVAQQITDALKLGDEARRNLAALIGRRNKVVHELTHRIHGAEIRTFWRLAKATVHHLVAKLSGFASYEDKARKLEEENDRAWCAKDDDLVYGFGTNHWKREHNLSKAVEQILTDGSPEIVDF